jgi:two-component system cell cycle response regulator CpdR
MEDEPEIATLYSHVLIDKGHEVTLARTAEDCLKIYSDSLHREQMEKKILRDVQPYDVVILDYKMPDRNGLEVAKEILAINSRQRIVFVSAFVRKWLYDSLKELNIPVEFLQKPVLNQVLIDNIEQKEVYEELERLNIDTEPFKKAGLSHQVLREILIIVRKSHRSKLSR